MNPLARSNPGTTRAFWPVPVILVAASILYCLPLFRNLDNWGRQDWDQFTFRYATPRVALLRDHVLPTWNPYASGGNVLLAHPDSPVLSPWYLIVLALDAPIGLRVQVVLFMALGAVGMAAFVRRLGAPRLGALAGGIVFMMSSHFALHITEGHLEWCVLGLMPWLALCLMHQTWRSAIVGALLLASVLTFGAVYVPAIYLPFFTVWTLFEAIRQRRLFPLMRWAAVVVVAVLLASPKLLPVVAFASNHPRELARSPDAPLSLWPTMFGDPRQANFYKAFRDRELQPGNFAKVMTDAEARPFLATLDGADLELNFHEYGCYIGVAGILLSILGAPRAGRQLWPLYAAGALAAVAVLGAHSAVDLWSALLRLPLYHQLRVPSRFLMAVLFVLAVSAAFGIDVLLGASRASLQRWRRPIGLVVIALLYGELVVMGWSLFGDIFVVPPIALEQFGAFGQRCDAGTHVYKNVIDSHMYACLLGNSGDLDAYENLTVTRGHVRLVRDPGYRGEAYLEAGRGTAELRAWTMSRVTVQVSATGPDRLILNQNFNRGWRARVRDARERVVEADAFPNDDGLISVPVGDQTREVELSYVEPGLAIGMAISGPVFLLCMLSLVFAPRRSASVRRPLGGA